MLYIRIAGENAKFGQPEINLGIIPGYEAQANDNVSLHREGRRHWSSFLTGDKMKAQDALQWGLVNYVTSPEELIPTCLSILNKIKTKSPLVVDRIIACVNSHYENGTDGFELEIDEFSQCMNTEDFKEGTAAFLEKRPANFKGK